MKDNKELHFELEELRGENKRLKERLQISPQGDDKIDELEEALDNCKFQLTTNKATCIKSFVEHLIKTIESEGLLSGSNHSDYEVVHDLIDLINETHDQYNNIGA